MSERTGKPIPLTVLPDEIPPVLKDHPHWVVWRYVWRKGDGKTPGKWTKPPHRVDGRLASATDPSTWTTFENACHQLSYEHVHFIDGRWSGVGFCLTPELGIVALDFDHAMVGGEVSDRVRDTIRAIGSYTEWSPSGVGIRVFCRGTLPQKFIVRPWIEIYDRERFLTVTGNRLHGSPTAIVDAQDALDGLMMELGVSGHQGGGERPAAATTGPSRPMLITLSDLEVLDKCRRAKNGWKFNRLYDHGDLSDYSGDHSRADAALVAMLAFYAERDQVDRLFRRSALNRDKWEKRDKYRAATVALGEGGQKWTPPQPKRQFASFRGGKVERVVGRATKA